ncbi:MAG: hypothetical protein EOO39_27285 [Cytophagaceae bacterium]|nr:MAG: hypothetical protein EOO39_27285 [Cytophagaceae bacterium]
MTVWLGPPFIEYVITEFGAPLNVIVACWPEQIVVFPEIETVNGGVTVIVTIPDAGWVQLGVPEIETLTNEYVVVALYV